MSNAEIVEKLSENLKDLPQNMRLFSLCLRSLYAENALGSSANKTTGINNIHDQTRQDAMVYVKGILPLSTQMVRFVQEFFENYEGLELEEWEECLPDIIKEVTVFQNCCTEVVRMHEEMMISLKQRQDEAKVLLSELKDLNMGLEKKIAKLEAEVDRSMALAFRLLFVPLVGPVATTVLCIKVDGEIAKVVAGGKQLTINEAAIMIVSDYLMPALTAFINGLTAVAGFFDVMKEELTSLESNGKSAVESPTKRHYLLMKKKALKITGSCEQFYAMIPGVRTDCCASQRSR
ncbi:hypothetical protein BSL78_27490 [Apostichopus japonicus]|uniref:Uncharacterized protein n=1 Tax=Stichopus japonicus TaxID=307972 RepID=A0A2G8JIX6_STIJA|nr:hypothetical protein BSL78_27490 [Apostichopus japonicus]